MMAAARARTGAVVVRRAARRLGTASMRVKAVLVLALAWRQRRGPHRRAALSPLGAFLGAFELGLFGALERCRPRREALVAQHAQGFDFWPLAVARACS